MWLTQSIRQRLNLTKVNTLAVEDAHADAQCLGDSFFGRKACGQLRYPPPAIHHFGRGVNAIQETLPQALYSPLDTGNVDKINTGG